MKKYFAVIDTNVIISSQLSSREDSPVVLIWNYIVDGLLVPLYNEDILFEYEQVLKREKFGFPEEAVRTIIDAIKLRGEKCDCIETTLEASDPDDNFFLGVMASREDSFLVTGNFKHYPKIDRILSPIEMVWLIESSGDNGSTVNEPHSFYL